MKNLREWSREIGPILMHEGEPLGVFVSTYGQYHDCLDVTLLCNDTDREVIYSSKGLVPVWSRGSCRCSNPYFLYLIRSSSYII